MKKRIYLYLERLYPYVLSFAFCLFLYKKEFNFINNSNVDNLIDGLVTMESIVIGLIGAIIPVILSMKNESKFVKYVFENDTEGLLRKYLTITIGVGLLSVAFSLSMYIRDEYSEIVRDIMYQGWIFLIILFLLLTYRSMKYMIIIIFTPDNEDESPGLSISAEQQAEIRKRYIRNE